MMILKCYRYERHFRWDTYIIIIFIWNGFSLLGPKKTIEPSQNSIENAPRFLFNSKTESSNEIYLQPTDEKK